MLPAVQRYISQRVDGLYVLARQRDEAFYILSGEYGLLGPEAMIPWYDHLLLDKEVAALVPRVAASLASEGVSELVYCTADIALVAAVAPYLELIQRACTQAEIELTVEFLPGNPA